MKRLFAEVSSQELDPHKLTAAILQVVSSMTDILFSHSNIRSSLDDLKVKTVARPHGIPLLILHCLGNFSTIWRNHTRGNMSLAVNCRQLVLVEIISKVMEKTNTSSSSSNLKMSYHYEYSFNLGASLAT